MTTTILRLDASIRQTGSATRAIADTLEKSLLSGLGNAEIVRREIGLTPVPATAWADAVFGPHTPAEQRSPRQDEAMALATTLVDELVEADAYVFAVPFYNFGVSQHFKAWVDLALTDPRVGPGGHGAIKGRPAELIVARGGGYGPGTPRHGWDHGTAWYRRMLEDVWMLEVELIECELTLADVTPAMESLRGLAAENLARAHAAAEENGRRLAQRLVGSAPMLDLARTGS
ncbi:flavodoxin family protein [Arsenicitalea aurantiaca]|uniref:Flavodoxin family protein n=1 Tax=Arsenicitalea aurantiaca TaxID=1783274 RepID=A0A433XLT7_9HYPH|nr:NAD(P)H-dependent oxidoreductase [Arsenicitalea aurantiaca]RUT35045.1 flavodoxin family protein [Arsenicitalea aurantiaca]